MEAANAAEGDGRPPPELVYEWQLREHPGALLNSGGLRDQPYGLMRRMRVAYNVWSAVSDYLRNNQSVEWTRKNPERYKIVSHVLRLKILKEREEQESQGDD